MLKPHLLVALLALSLAGCGNSGSMTTATVRSNKTDDQAYRTVQGRIRNLTAATLHLHSAAMKHGVMKSPPPPTIAPDGTGEFEAQSTGPASDAEGTVIYRLGAADGPAASFYFNNPYRGDSSVAANAPPGHAATYEWRGDSEARVTYTLRKRAD